MLGVCIVVAFVFFFSSRRRHTRSLCDWSSDVCSSDLPARVENLFKLEPLVNQIVLVGDRLPYLTALFTVNTQVAETLKGMEPLKGRPAPELVAAEPVAEELRKAVKRVNKQLAPFEQIRKYRILDRELSIEHGELTATMKVRRARALENFRDHIEELYPGKEDNLEYTRH